MGVPGTGENGAGGGGRGQPAAPSAFERPSRAVNVTAPPPKRVIRRPAPPVPPPSARPSSERRRKRALAHLGVWLAIGVAWVALVLAALVFYYAMTLPDPRLAGLSRRPPNMTILAANGAFLAERGMRRDYVVYDELPRHLVDAVLATEDRRFFYHFGFDPVGLIRAALANWHSGRIVQGGSTVTQQLAKTLFLKPTRSWTRKFEELILALWLEIHFTKQEILELYLNRIYFGSGNYGIGAASYHYFGKRPQELGLAEAALLVGLIKAPSYLSPSHNRDGADERTGLVLQNMLDGGHISRRDYRRALAHPAKLHTVPQTPGFDYVVDWIAEMVPHLVGEIEANLTVETTIDFELNRSIGAIVRRMISRNGPRLRAGEAAVVLLTPHGEVKALVGGRDYRASQFNRAVKARRQPGSAFKPFIYLAALESGLTPGSHVLDLPVRVGGWRPSNYAGRYRGRVTLRTALMRSSNVAAVRLMLLTGRRQVMRTAQRLGITTDLDVGPTLALGTAEVSVLEMTAAYAHFANGGYGVLPHIIKRVVDEHGTVVYERRSAEPQRVIKAAHVGPMNDMLNAVIVSGTGRRAALPRHPAAGKTGTTSGYQDAWFVGYTANWVAGIWVGNDRRRRMRRVTGGSLPAEIWRAVMLRAHRNVRPKALPGTRGNPIITRGTVGRQRSG